MRLSRSFPIYHPPPLSIWCPFDTDDSLYVKHLLSLGYTVKATHISNGQNFFDFPIENVDCDYIISNPPYSIKTDVLERLFEIGKPFAMLVGVVGLFESQRRFDLFKNNKFEIMYFNRRIAFFGDYSEQHPSRNPPFSSVYICHNVLPKQIIFKEIQKTS